MGPERQRHDPPGRVRHEAAAGIEAATATGPLTLGRTRRAVAGSEAGYDADVITLDADPLAGIAVLAGPAHVTGVWAAGGRVKAA